MAESERLRQHREHPETNERERQQQQYRDKLVSQRVAEYVAAGRRGAESDAVAINANGRADRTEHHDRR
jgi:hypothetical protein